MSYINLQCGDYIEHLNMCCRFERRQEHRTEWRSTRTFEHFSFTDAEIQRLIRKGELKLFAGGAQPPHNRPVSKIHGQRGPTSADIEEAERRLKYVQEIHHRSLLSEEATPSLWLEAIDRVWADEGCHWKRLRSSRKGEPVDKPSLKTVRRWVANAGNPPKLKNLLPAHRYKGNYEDRLDPDVRALLDELVLTHWMKRPRIEMDAFLTIVEGAVSELNQRRVGLKPFPSPKTAAVQSSIDAQPRDEVKRARYGNQAAFLSFGSGEAQEDPKAPLDRVELDSTPADLFVVDPETMLPLGRPTIVLCLDRCTRMILGWYVSFEKPSIHSLMQCLRNAVLSKDYVAEMRERYGWEIRHEPETFGVPRVLVLDRALENISPQIAKFAVRAGVNQIHLMGGKRPWLKGAVERVIKTMSERLLHPTPGTTFHNTLMKMGYDPEKDAVCTLDDLDYALHKYFIDIYPRTPRRSLNERRSIDLWRALTRKYPVDSISEVSELNHWFGRTERAKPGRHGINYERMQFFSKELLDYQTNPAFQNALKTGDGKTEFYVDTADLSQIVVRLPHKEQSIVVSVAPKWRKYATGLSLFHHRKIREYNAETARAANDADDLLQCKLELMEIMRGTFNGKRGSIRSGQMLARMQGVARRARSGTHAQSKVKGHFDAALTMVEPDAAFSESHRIGTVGPESAEKTDDNLDQLFVPSVARRARKGYRP